MSTGIFNLLSLNVLQIEGIANGLCYLHNCMYGPLYHGDLKGVGLFALAIQFV